MKGPETSRNNLKRIQTGFYEKYMSGQGLDIGYRGSLPEADPVLPTAQGIELDFPGYDGVTLPFASESQDYVFSSHSLEHIKSNYLFETIQEWFRVLKIDGHLVICVPHRDLYEKKWQPPSKYNGDHQRFYTPSSLLHEIEYALDIPNSYRIVHMRDNDDGYDYNVPPNTHCSGAMEIELVIKKIPIPTWNLLD